MRSYLYLFLVCLFITSCSESDNILSPENGGENPEGKKVVDIKFNAKHNRANVFELVEFYIYSDEAFNLLELNNTYDSITWSVPELGKFHLMRFQDEDKSNSNGFTFSWSHNFFFPGSYKTIFSGYKDNKMIISDTLIVDIENNKDFLCYNWDEVTAPSTISSGYHDTFDKYNFGTIKDIKNGIPSVILYMQQDDDELESSSLKTKETLRTLMTSLYGNPVEIDEVPAIYTELFKNKPEQSEPIDIWLTPKSQIVIFKYKDRLYEYPQYKILAEPRVL